MKSFGEFVFLRIKCPTGQIYASSVHICKSQISLLPHLHSSNLLIMNSKLFQSV